MFILENLVIIYICYIKQEKHSFNGYIREFIIIYTTICLF